MPAVLFLLQGMFFLVFWLNITGYLLELKEPGQDCLHGLGLWVRETKHSEMRDDIDITGAQLHVKIDIPHIVGARVLCQHVLENVTSMNSVAVLVELLSDLGGLLLESLRGEFLCSTGQGHLHLELKAGEEKDACVLRKDLTHFRGPS